MLGVLAALPAEARCLIASPARSTVIALGDTRLYVSGIGPARAMAGAARLIDHGVTALMSWGTAGGLTAATPSGTAVIPRTVVTEDKQTFASDAAWHTRLLGQLAPRIAVNAGTLASVNAAVATAAMKTKLAHRSGAVAVDMESASVAKVAAEASIPFIAVRSIADPQYVSLPHAVVSAVDDFGVPHWCRFAQALAARPADVLTLISLAYYLKRALATLRQIFEIAGPTMGFVQHAPRR